MIWTRYCCHNESTQYTTSGDYGLDRTVRTEFHLDECCHTFSAAGQDISRGSMSRRGTLIICLFFFFLCCCTHSYLWIFIRRCPLDNLIASFTALYSHAPIAKNDDCISSLTLLLFLLCTIRSASWDFDKPLPPTSTRYSSTRDNAQAHPPLTHHLIIPCNNMSISRGHTETFVLPHRHPIAYFTKHHMSAESQHPRQLQQL